MPLTEHELEELDIAKARLAAIKRKSDSDTESDAVADMMAAAAREGVLLTPRQAAWAMAQIAEGNMISIKSLAQSREFRSHAVH
jgi:hypothetical protein